MPRPLTLARLLSDGLVRRALSTILIRRQESILQPITAEVRRLAPSRAASAPRLASSAIRNTGKRP